MRFPRFHFGVAIQMGLSMLCMSAVPVFADGHVFVPTPDASYVYVTNYSDNTVSVIDPLTNEVVDTIVVGGNPAAVATSKTGTGVYIANYADGTVSVIDRTTNVIDQTITVGTSPAGIAITPDDTEAYVTNSDSASVSVINLATGTVTNTISVGNIPTGIAMSPDGHTVYVANSNDNTVSVISTVTKTQLTAISSPAFNIPMTIAFSSDGTSAYVGNDGDTNVVIINTGTRSVTTSINTGVHHLDGIGIAPHTNTLFVTSLTDNQVFYDNLSSSVTGSIAGINGADGITFSQDGTTGYVVAFYAGGLATFDVASRALINMIIVGTHPGAVAIWEKPIPVSSSSSSAPAESLQHSGGHRGNSTQQIVHILMQRESSSLHSAAPQETMSSALQTRTCDRVMKWFKNDMTMLGRVNARLEKRFGFTCSK